jgi:dihydroorotate dehydrogenase
MSLRPSHLYPLFRPMLFALDPEIAHDVAFSSLDTAARCGLARLVLPSVPTDPVEVMGLTFANRVGLAARR